MWRIGTNYTSLSTRSTRFLSPKSCPAPPPATCRGKATVSAPSSGNGSTFASRVEPSSLGSSADSARPSIVHSLLAVCIGVTTVSTVAAVVEQSTGNEVPYFDVNGDRFDQNTFQGRFSKMLLSCDPRLLLYSAEEVQQAAELVYNADALIACPPEAVQNIHRTLWEAHRIASAGTNDGEPVPRPFRMSGYVPFNGPICAAMVCSSGTPSLLFFNWLNQSQNAGVNYFNRNAASFMSDEKLLKSYVGAVGVALGVAFGLSTFVKRRFDRVRAKQVMQFVAFPSTVIASSLNCYIVRSGEIDTGIPIMDRLGEPIEVPGCDNLSQIAAASGVYATTASRAILNIPVLLVPPLLMNKLSFIKKIVARNPALSTPITLYLLLTSFGIGLPAACALFPQIVEVPVQELETKFHNLRDYEGRKIQKVYYNKGL